MRTKLAPYEKGDGYPVSERWADREIVPIPTAATRNRSKLPPLYQLATLAASTKDAYPVVLFDTAFDYLCNFHEVELRGKWLTLLGTSGVGKSHAAAAVVNEVIGQIKWEVAWEAYWLSTSWGIQELLDLRRAGKTEEYFSRRRKIMRCDLLVVDDLLEAADYGEVREYLFAIYDFRYQHKLPIITTANANVTAEDWSAIERAFNGPFARRLRDQSKGFTCMAD